MTGQDRPSTYLASVSKFWWVFLLSRYSTEDTQETPGLQKIS